MPSTTSSGIMISRVKKLRQVVEKEPPQPKRKRKKNRSTPATEPEWTIE